MTDIGKWAFTGCSGLVSATLPVKLYDKWQSVPERRNCSELHLTGEIATASPKVRKDALVIFAKDPENLKQPWAAGYLKYAKSNASKLVDQVVAHPELCALMCSEKLIPGKDLEAYANAAAVSGNAEIIAMLLEYQNQDDVKKGKAKAGKAKEKQEEKVLDRMIARQERVGIEGLNFVVTGNLKHFARRQELQTFLSDFGANLKSSMSAKVDYLIMNPDSVDGEKKKKADELGISVITEHELFCLLPGEPGSYIEKDGILRLYYGDDADVVLLDGITRIGAGAFANRRNLICISIPESVTGIEANAFAWCHNIAEIIIPANVSSIGEWAFLGCARLKDITIPEGVSRIGDDTFSWCDNLTIHAPAGSYAAKYAKEKGISFVAE